MVGSDFRAVTENVSPRKAATLTHVSRMNKSRLFLILSTAATLLYVAKLVDGSAMSKELTNKREMAL